MCLLIVKPAGYSIPYEYLESAAFSHPHGSGLVYSDGSRSFVKKGYLWNEAQIAEELANLEDYPALIHFRFATHGSKNNNNTHPFPLLKGWHAAHNGVIKGIQCRKDESDTRSFIRQYVNPLIARDYEVSDVVDFIGQLLGKGNKMAFISPEGKLHISNEDEGHWSGGVWFSNDSYQPHYRKYVNHREEPFNYL